MRTSHNITSLLGAKGHPFGSCMQGRAFSSAAYRYGFNGKEKEANGTADNYDFGARIYDGRLGRWLAVDLFFRKYSELTPYNYCGNSPIQAKDPDGKLIIFINGLYGFPNSVCCGGTKEYWGAEWINRAQSRVGDYNAMYFDGSVGGTSNLANTGYNASEAYRTAVGYLEGLASAESIINGLHKSVYTGDIDEPIRFVTNSMGAAYQRGFSQALTDYVKIKNAEIQVANKIIDDEISGLRAAQQGVLNKLESEEYSVEMATALYSELDERIAQVEATRQKEINITIEWVLDIDPHQTNTADPNAGISFFSRSDDEAINFWESTFVDRPNIVEGAFQIPTEKGQGHHSSFFNTDNIPTGYGPGAGVQTGQPGSENNVSVEHPR